MAMKKFEIHLDAAILLAMLMLASMVGNIVLTREYDDVVAENVRMKLDRTLMNWNNEGLQNGLDKCREDAGFNDPEPVPTPTP